MQSEFRNFFEFVTSYYSAEIMERLSQTEYADLQRKEKRLLEREMKDDDFMAYCDALERRLSCYYEQAAIVVLKHTIELFDECGM